MFCFKKSLACLVLLAFAAGGMQADIYARQNDEPEDPAMQSLGDESRQILKDARSYNELKTLDLAIEQYEELLRRYPGNPFLLKETGDAYAKKKDFTKAKELFDQALFIRPYDPNIRLAWVRTIEDYAKDRNRAIEELKKILMEDPTFNEGKKELAKYVSWDQKWDQAVAIYDQILTENPTDIDTMFDKAEVLSWSKHLPESIDLYKQILKLDPSNLKAEQELAKVYMEKNDWKNAAKIYEHLFKMNPNDPEVLQALGDAYFFDQRYISAKRVYSEVIASNPQAERQLSARLSSISTIYAPTLSHSFLYYAERNRQGADEGVPNRTIAESLYNTIEYSHPVLTIMRLIFSFATRDDDTIKRVSYNYGVGAQTRILDNLWHRVDWKWEPLVKRQPKVEPRWYLGNTFSWKPKDRWQVDMFHRFNTYWDKNKANAQGFAISRYFLEKYDLLMGYRLTNDIAEKVNPYYVTIKHTQGKLLLLTNSFSLEKYWSFFNSVVLTTGTSYDVNSQGRNILTLYGSTSIALTRRMNLIGGMTYSRDNRDIEDISASSYISYKF
ncbi:MAG: tetratricopeptide repeat protein [Candidatus Omnitrophica bacterium]|nr:tetratricopeptide repeat protein [Candidatus Omnitrophota bacterium]